MDPKSGNPLRVFLNPFAIWTDLALRTGQAMIASAHAVAAEAKARRIAVIPTADAPAREVAPTKAPRKAKANAKGKTRGKAKTKPRARR
jgi:hypothetical protein